MITRSTVCVLRTPSHAKTMQMHSIMSKGVNTRLTVCLVEEKAAISLTFNSYRGFTENYEM
jgi:hypothetical protein